MAAVHIAASFFRSAGIDTLAGVCPERPGPGCLRKLPSWLGQLAALSSAEALALLSEHVLRVPKKLWSQVEAEYNAGVRAANCPGLALMLEGSLASRAACFGKAHCEHVSVNLASAPAGPKGRFYYIAAGVGSGIADIQEVCAKAH
jgi:hypothetical protein